MTGASRNKQKELAKIVTQPLDILWGWFLASVRLLIWKHFLIARRLQSSGLDQISWMMMVTKKRATTMKRVSQKSIVLSTTGCFDRSRFSPSPGMQVIARPSSKLFVSRGVSRSFIDDGLDRAWNNSLYRTNRERSLYLSVLFYCVDYNALDDYERRCCQIKQMRSNDA